MNCFRSLFQLSLGKLRREREFRADRVAAEITSPRDVAGALLRTTACSNFRHEIQQKLFEQERVLETANIAGQIAEGFSTSAVRFAVEHDIGELKSSHPFDTHPPLADRLEAVGVPLLPDTAASLLAAPGDGGWYRMIDNAEQIERQQWDAFEDKFRSFHEATLPYRLLPETAEECAIVVKAFPAVTVEGKAGSLALDYERLHFTSWATPIEYREITHCAVNDGVLQIHYQRDGKRKEKLKLSTFGKRKQEALDAINRYLGRYQALRPTRLESIASKRRPIHRQCKGYFARPPAHRGQYLVSLAGRIRLENRDAPDCRASGTVPAVRRRLDRRVPRDEAPWPSSSLLVLQPGLVAAVAALDEGHRGGVKRVVDPEQRVYSAVSEIVDGVGKPLRFELRFEIDEHCSQVACRYWLDKVQVESHLT